MDNFISDQYFMNEALKEAKKALDANEVPIGAVIVSNNRIIARGHNLTETLNDPTAHAEMQAFTAATENIGGKYLNDCTLYVTLEPCVMCAGALAWSQIDRVIFGAYDKKKGFTLIQQPILHPKTDVIGGILQSESEAMLKSFFKKLRK